MDPTDPGPDPQHWNRSFKLVLYTIFCGVVYLQQLPVRCCLMSGLCLLYVWLLFYVPNLAEKYHRRLLLDFFEGFLAHCLNR